MKTTTPRRRRYDEPQPHPIGVPTTTLRGQPTAKRALHVAASMALVLAAGGAAMAQSARGGRAAPATASAVSGSVLGHTFRAQRAFVFDYAGNENRRTIRIANRPVTCDTVGSFDLPAGTVYVDVQIPWRAGTFRPSEISVSPGIQGDDSAQGFVGPAQLRLDAATHQVGARTRMRLQVSPVTDEGVTANQTMSLDGEIEVEDCLGH